MEEKIVVSDFDGTITKQDTLYTFLTKFAKPEWLQVEDEWLMGDIGSGECLQREFDLVPGLSKKMITDFIDSVEIDDYFKKFNEIRIKNKTDFIVVSDGLDYFIDRIFKKHGIKDVKVITNHAEFKNGKFIITFPNKSKFCKQDAGTCKCSVIANLRGKYKDVYYVGDGTSDHCVADKVDYLFAKSGLLQYCRDKDINCIEYSTYNEVVNYDRLGFDIR